jgi:hypothetical protein
MVLNRKQQFALIESALDLMTCSARNLSLHIHAIAPPPADWASFEVQRDEWTNTFEVTDVDGVLVALDSSIGIKEWLRSNIPSSRQIVNISLEGPPVGNEEHGCVPLFQLGERGSVPLARRQRNSHHEHPGGFQFHPVRNRD